MKIITTHLSADFDAFASALAAQHLYPGHKVLFPGSLEPTVRRFRAAIPIEFDEIRLKDLRRHRIKHAIVLDTQDSVRLGEAWELLQRDQCPILRIDHHEDGDLPKGSGDLVRAVGATSTLICEIFQERGLHPTPEIASLLLLGIYEDTGRLSFREADPADFRSAAWLLEQGGDLGWVRKWISRTLEPEQFQLLQELIAGAEERIISSTPVVVTTVEIEDYPEEAAAAIHQWIDAFRLPVTAVLLVNAPTVRIIFRSRIEEIDVGRIAREMGGGGHSTAASATIRGMPAVEVRERVWRHFRSELPGVQNAGEAALGRIFSLNRDTRVSEAAQRLNEWRVNAVPVSDGEQFCGTLTRQILDRSLSLGLGDRPVDVVMEPGVFTVDAEDSLEEIKDIFLEGSRRFVIVEQKGKPIGILTRMEIFRRLFEGLPVAGARLDNRMASHRPLRQNIGRKLWDSLPEWVRPVLTAVKELCPEGKPPVYLVGGAVRDLLLGRPIEDIDLVVEGDGISLAEALATRLGARSHPHAPFITSVVKLPDGNSIDVASARTEFYTAPAALPNVITSLIRQDLYRRDFTINALAVSLSGENTGQIVDHFGGRKDLASGMIRVLHSLSFIDDPTRAIRAVRYARRLGFSISSDTKHLIKTAAREMVFQHLSAHRLRHELELLLAEEHPAGAFELLAELSLLNEIDPGLRWNEESDRILREVEAQMAWFLLENLQPQPRPLLLYLGAVILAGAPSEEEIPQAVKAADRLADRLIARLQLTGRLATDFHLLPENVMKLRHAALVPESPSKICRKIREMGPEPLLLAMSLLALAPRRLLAERAGKGLLFEMPIGGRDLREAGVEESPQIGKILATTRDAILDGITRPEDALSFALRQTNKENTT